MKPDALVIREGAFPPERCSVRGFSQPRLAKGGFEGEGEVPRRLETLPRFLLQTVLHDALQCRLTVRSRWP